MKLFSENDLSLLAGREFNSLLANDPILNQLESSAYNPGLERCALFETLGGGYYMLGKLEVTPLTIAKWTFLWSEKNPFVTGGTISIHDLNLILRTLAEEDLPAEKDDTDYVAASGLEPGQIIGQINEMIRTAFLPLEQLPPSEKDRRTEYDGTWAVSLASMAARESGHNLKYCFHEMSLSCVFFLYLVWRKRECADGDRIRHRTGEEINVRIAERINELSEEFLKKSFMML